MGQEKTRVHTLAKELNLEPQDVLNICKNLGINVKNRLSMLANEQCQLIKKFVHSRRTANPAVKPHSQQVHINPKVVKQVPPIKFMISLPGDKQGGVKQTPLPNPSPSGLPQLPPPEKTEVSKEVGVQRLLEAGKKAKISQVEVILDLARIDPECALFKIRKITERLCRVITNTSDADLNELVRNISYKKILSSKTVSYLHQIRTLGNAAVHAGSDQFEETFDRDDVNNAAGALASVLDDLVKRKILPFEDSESSGSKEK